MKKVYFLALIMIFGSGLFAQPGKSVIPKSLQYKTVPKPLKIDQSIPLNEGNALTNPKSASSVGVVIGGTRYDAQSNGSMQQRIYSVFNTATSKEEVTGIWTRGVTDAGTYPDRGTGYNYFNGTAWGPLPTGRIESMRTGWPVYQALNGGGEIVISHQGGGTLPLVMNTRPVKGTGTWTQTTIAQPTGAAGILWPSMVTSGPNHNYIHLITLTTPTAYTGGTVYQGLDGAIVYYRSLDGGVTWDKAGVILDQMTSSDYFGFTADEYIWGTPHGDTIYFAVGGNWTDTFIMISYDNGNTWTKKDVLSNAHKADGTTVFADPFYCCDGSMSVEMDKDGVFHLAFGRMCALNDGTGRFYRPYTDGLIYWNSTMPMIQDSLNLDTLYNHGQLLGYVYSNAANDSILAIPYYGVGMTSFPQLTIDNANNIFAIWSAVTVGNPYNGLNYRHIWEKHSDDHGQMWSDSNDFNKGLAYIYKEFVYPTMGKEKLDSKIRFTYQSADVPGSAIQDATNVTAHDNTIEYREEEFLGVGIYDNQPAISGNSVSQNVPNPFRGASVIEVNVAVPGNVSIEIQNITGQKLMKIDKGYLKTGKYQFSIDGNNFSSGVYIYAVKIGHESYVHKMVIK